MLQTRQRRLDCRPWRRADDAELRPELEATVGAAAAISAAMFEQVVHQHMPMFHMEHCVFAHVLSSGTDYRTCGRPCKAHSQTVTAHRAGVSHPLIPDVGCRNTIFNGAAQGAAEYIWRHAANWACVTSASGCCAEEGGKGAAPRCLPDRYARVVSGAEDGRAAWRQLKVLNQLGVTRGTLGE